jgi:NhaP-type Na+/H+ or K+/H+ antiporter
MLVVLAFVLAAVAVIVVLQFLADRTGLPAAALLTVAGLVYAVLPGPNLTLDPHVILTFVIPPLIYSAALNSSLLAIRKNLRTVISLSIGLVLAAALLTGVGMYLFVPGVGLAAGIAFGAAISPTDPVAALAVGGRAGLPPKLITIIEGEGLLNDATALTTLTVAVTAATSGGFSLGDAVLRFLLASAGGLLSGVVVAVSLGVVLLLRPLWLGLTQTLPRALRTRRGKPAASGAQYLAGREVAVLSWSGTRGVISLAAIFTLPLVTSSGHAFPGRDLLLFCTYLVVVVTLVGQGFTFAWVTKAMGVRADPADAALVRTEARAASVQAGLSRLDQIAADWEVPGPALAALRAHLDQQARRYRQWLSLGWRRARTRTRRPRPGSWPPSRPAGRSSTRNARSCSAGATPGTCPTPACASSSASSTTRSASCSRTMITDARGRAGPAWRARLAVPPARQSAGLRA